jgi:hypothetical protein
VVDDCGGTGTTNLACIRLGMSGYCIDKDITLTFDAELRARWYFWLLAQVETNYHNCQINMC